MTEKRNVGRWARVQAGDVMFFAGRGAVRATAVVTHKLHNPALARRLWSVDDRGSTWEYIYFVDQVAECEVPYEDFNAAAGYSLKNVIQGFEVMDAERSARILAVLDMGRAENAVAGTEEDARAAAELDPSKPLDAVGQTLIRKEQGFLRKTLFGKASAGHCVLCGELVPVDLLVAAHVKKRSKCAREEKLDFRNNVSAMCRLGCDDLFERGYVVVADGVVIANARREASATPAVRALIQRIAGRTCPAFTPGSAPYFVWHQASHT